MEDDILVSPLDCAVISSGNGCVQLVLIPGSGGARNAKPVFFLYSRERTQQGGGWPRERKRLDCFLRRKVAAARIPPRSKVSGPEHAVGEIVVAGDREQTRGG